MKKNKNLKQPCDKKNTFHSGEGMKKQEKIWVPPKALVLVEWSDTNSVNSSWCPPMQLTTFVPTTCYTVGFIVLRDEDKIILTQNIGVNPGAESKILHAMVIPIRCIKTIVELKQGQII